MLCLRTSSSWNAHFQQDAHTTWLWQRLETSSTPRFCWWNVHTGELLVIFIVLCSVWTTFKVQEHTKHWLSQNFTRGVAKAKLEWYHGELRTPQMRISSKTCSHNRLTLSVQRNAIQKTVLYEILTRILCRNSRIWSQHISAKTLILEKSGLGIGFSRTGRNENGPVKDSDRLLRQNHLRNKSDGNVSAPALSPRGSTVSWDTKQSLVRLVGMLEACKKTLLGQVDVKMT